MGMIPKTCHLGCVFCNLQTDRYRLLLFLQRHRQEVRWVPKKIQENKAGSFERLTDQKQMKIDHLIFGAFKKAMGPARSEFQFEVLEAIKRCSWCFTPRFMLAKKWHVYTSALS